MKVTERLKIIKIMIKIKMKKRKINKRRNLKHKK